MVRQAWLRGLWRVAAGKVGSDEVKYDLVRFVMAGEASSVAVN